MSRTVVIGNVLYCGSVEVFDVRERSHADAALFAAARNALPDLLRIARGLADYDDAMPCPLCDAMALRPETHDETCLVGMAKRLAGGAQ